MAPSPASTSFDWRFCLRKNGKQRNNHSEKATSKLTNFAIWLKGYGTLSTPALLNQYQSEARRVRLPFSITCCTFCSRTKAYSMSSRCCGKPFATQCKNVLRSMQDCFLTTSLFYIRKSQDNNQTYRMAWKMKQQPLCWSWLTHMVVG